MDAKLWICFQATHIPQLGLILLCLAGCSAVDNIPEDEASVIEWDFKNGRPLEIVRQVNDVVPGDDSQ